MQEGFTKKVLSEKEPDLFLFRDSLPGFPIGTMTLKCVLDAYKHYFPLSITEKENINSIIYQK